MSNPLQKPEILENFFSTQPDYQKNQEKALDLFLKTHPKKASQTFWQQFSLAIFNFTLPKFLRLSLTVFCLFCVIFTLSFASVLAYSQAQGEAKQSYREFLFSSKGQSGECKQPEIKYKGNLSIDASSWSIPKPDDWSDEQILWIEEQKYDYKWDNTTGFIIKNSSVAFSCLGKISPQAYKEFYDTAILDRYPSWQDYQKCAFNRMIRFWKKNSDYLCEEVDTQDKGGRIQVNKVPFLDENSRERIQKDKVYYSIWGRFNNNVWLDNDTTIHFLDKDNIFYEIAFYGPDAEYMVRNYDLEISLK